MSTPSVQDVLKDILKHTHGLGVYEMVRISSNDDGATVIETVNEDKSAIFKGELHAPFEQLDGNTVGLARMSVLDGYLKYEGFTADDAQVEVVKQNRNGEDIPVEVKLVDAQGTDAHYRFMSSEVINQQLKDVKLTKVPNFDVEFMPSMKSLKDLGYFNSVLSAFESTFSPETNNGDLYFNVGDSGGDRTKILIQKGVDGEVSSGLSWPLDLVLKMLKLGAEAETTMHICDQGLIQIRIDSGLGVYNYYLPATS